MNKSRSGGGARKIGRDKKHCQRYRLEGREAINRRRKVKKHLNSHPNDVQNAGVLKRL